MKNWTKCIVLVFLFSCGGNGLPGGVLQKDQMEAVVWDMIEADQYYRDFLTKDSLKLDLKTERVKLYERVFQMHHTNRETFDKSYAYYSAHPKLMQEVFDSLSAKGTRKLQDLYKPAIQPVDTSSQSRLRKRLDSLKPQ